MLFFETETTGLDETKAGIKRNRLRHFILTWLKKQESGAIYGKDQVVQKERLLACN